MRFFRAFKSLYVQVLCGVVLGVLCGHLFPEIAAYAKPFGDGFVRLIKMLIAPIVFCTIVMGIANMHDLKKLGRVGGKAFLYFEVLSTLALVIGLIVAKWLAPGEGMNVDPSTLDGGALATYTQAAATQKGTAQFLLEIIPNSFVDAFARSDLLQVLLCSVLFGVALSTMGPRGTPVVSFLEVVAHAFFRIVGFVMKLAPLGAFGAMAFTVGNYGLDSLAPLAKLMGTFYLTCALFVVVVLGAVCRYLRLSLWRLLRYLKEELLIVLGTSSSESVLPRMLAKMEKLGASKSVVGIVIPSGYSFNLDGTSIYLTMACLFVAQATNANLSLADELTLLAVLLLSSKGAAGVTGSGFITLAATLSTLPTIPVAGLTLILGIDRFMSEARALTNLVGNAVATLAVAHWEGELDHKRATRVLAGEHGHEHGSVPASEAETDARPRVSP